MKSRLRASLAVCFCFAAAGAGATELRDATTLSPREQSDFISCMLSEMGRDRSAEIAGIKAEHALKTPNPAPEDPVLDALTDVALSLQLGQIDCARKMGIDPKTLPAVTIK